MPSVNTYSIKALAEPLVSISASPDRDVRYFLSEITGVPLAELFDQVQMSMSQYREFQAMCARRLRHEPVAYILGYSEFWGLRLQVNASVLIPRPETECLVEAVLQSHGDSSIRCLDLGTGSGAIALALATERSSWHVDALDRSQKAISCARENTSRQETPVSNLSFYCYDWTSFCSGDRESRYHVLVANPPYIDPVSDAVCTETRLYEPDCALYADLNGEADLIDLIDVGALLLLDAGWLYLEHGYDQGERVRYFMAKKGYQSITTMKDYAGHDRFTLGQWRIIR